MVYDPDPPDATAVCVAVWLLSMVTGETEIERAELTVREADEELEAPVESMTLTPKE